MSTTELPKSSPKHHCRSRKERDVSPNILSEDAIYFREPLREGPPPSVPPSTPEEQFNFDNIMKSVPMELPDLNTLDIPYVRSDGIRGCIEKLAEFFDCKDYTFNLVQFWFLDLVTDCLWRLQDEFLFTDEYQRLILTWILYIFNLIRDPQLNFSRKRLFQVFREAMEMAEEHVEAGERMLPPPEELFSLNELESEEHSYSSVFSIDSSESSSASSISSLEDDEDDKMSFVAFDYDEGDSRDIFILPNTSCLDDISLDTTLESLSEKSIRDDVFPEEEEQHYTSQIEILPEGDIEPSTYFDRPKPQHFYKPDPNIPARFLDLPEEEESIEESTAENTISETIEEITSDKFKWVDDTDKKYSILKHVPVFSRASAIPEQQKQESLTNIKKKKASRVSIKKPAPAQPKSRESGAASTSSPSVKEQQLMRAWFEYNMWEQQREAMSKPWKGWRPLLDMPITTTPVESVDAQLMNEYNNLKRDWLAYIKSHNHSIKKADEYKFINSCVLLVIKNMVFDYFYESFQFKLIKLTFQTERTLITQQLNEKWNVPKVPKGEFKRPPIKKVKKSPTKSPPRIESIPEKEKKSPPDKKKDADKTSPTKDTKSKESKDKMPKPHKPPKEDKEELARLKKEAERLEEERTREEENKRLIFPLTDAATDQFFRSIFKNWSAPKTSKKKGKEVEK